MGRIGDVNPGSLRKFIKDFVNEVSQDSPGQTFSSVNMPGFGLTDEFEARWSRENNIFSGYLYPFWVRTVSLWDVLTSINSAKEGGWIDVDRVAEKPEVILAASILPLESIAERFDHMQFLETVHGFSKYIHDIGK